MQTARAVLFPGARKVDLETVEVPSPGEGQVLIQTRCTLISTGTELTAFGGEFPPGSAWANYVRYPWRPGYSNVGVVVQTGPGVEDVGVGQRVVSHGAHASLVLQNWSQVQPVPEGVSDEEAAFCTLGVISLNGVRLSRLQLGESAVVCGVGLVGNLAVQLARKSGGWPVVALDLSEARLEMAAAHGATHTLQGDAGAAREGLLALNRGRLADVVFEVTGNPKVIPGLFRLARRLGRVILLGSPRGKTEVDFHDEVHTNGLHVIGAHNSTHTPVETPYNVWTLQRDGELFLDLVAAGEVRVNDLVTERFGWREAPAAFEMLWKDRARSMGVMLDWTG